MSLMDMNRSFKKYGTAFGIGLAGIMLVGTFAGFGANLFGGGKGGAVSSPMTGDDTVATVGDVKVSRALLESNLDRALQQQAMMGGAPIQPKPEEKNGYLIRVLDQVKQEQALVAAAKAAGVTVSDAEIESERENIWQQQRAGFAQTLGLPATATDQQIDRAISTQDPGRNLAAIKAQIPAEALRTKLYQDGLQKKLRDQVQIDPALLKRTYNEIQVRHILINFGTGSLPEEQAKAKAEKILAEVKANPAKMAQLAKDNSDDPGSKAKGGYYDWAPAAQYVPSFTEAALKAGVGKVYPDLVRVVQPNYSGFHIVKLEGERTPKPAPAPAKGAPAAPTTGVPADFDKNKQKYIDEYRDKLAGAAMQSAVAAALPGIETVVTDPGLRAAQLQQEAQAGPDKKTSDAKLTEALAELDKVKKDALGANAVPLQKAAILQQLGRDKDAIAAYEESLKFRNLPETHVALATLYLKLKDNANAKAQLAEAQKLPIGDMQQQMQLAQLLGQVGDKDGSKKAMDKAMEMFKRQQEMQRANIPQMPQAPAPEASPAAAAETPK
ncbi:MAG: peptidylprolyl isomerase [Armatimonadota bacterium]